MVWRGDVVVGVNDASGCDDMLKACREAPHQAACAPCTLRQAFPQDCLMLPVLTVLCGNTKIIQIGAQSALKTLPLFRNGILPPGRFSLGTYEQATRVARIVRWDGPYDFVVLEAGDARLRVTPSHLVKCHN